MTGGGIDAPPAVAGRRTARYRVRGPHGTRRDYARWTVVDTADRDIAVHTCRTKAEAAATARELNAPNPRTDPTLRKDS